MSRRSAGESGKAIDTAGLIVCAIRDDDQTVCWGNNERGQLGDGTSEARPGATTVLAPEP